MVDGLACDSRVPVSEKVVQCNTCNDDGVNCLGRRVQTSKQASKTKGKDTQSVLYHSSSSGHPTKYIIYNYAKLNLVFKKRHFFNDYYHKVITINKRWIKKL